MLLFPTRFNYADLLLLKDFLHSPLDFPVKSDGSCFPNLSLPINEEILTHTPPTSVRLLRSRQLRGEGTEGSHAKLLGERGQLGKAQVPLVWHKRDQQASRLANATGKWQLPIKREEVTPPSQA